MQPLRRREQSDPPRLVIILLALGLLLVLPCVFLVLLSRWLPRRLSDQRWFWPLVAAIGACCLASFFFVAHPLRTIPNQLEVVLIEAIREAKSGTWKVSRLWADLRPLWLDSLFIAPAAAYIAHFFAPQSAAQRLLAPRQKQAAAIRAASKGVKRRMARKPLPDQVGGQIVLGLPIGGDLREWVASGILVLSAHEMGKHGVVIGASGSGKSETLLRLAVGAARVLGWQVIYIDGKGDEEAGMRFVAAMRAAGIRRVKMFPAEAYNGWMGSNEALLSRLLAVEEFSDTHYKAIADNLLRLAINAPGGPIRGSADLLARLNLTNEFLLGLYAGYPEQEAYLAYLAKRDPLGVYNRYAALLGKLQGKLDGTWSYDSVDAAYISLDGLALSGIVSGLGRYFVEDFANYAGQRKPRERRVLFIFDDLGAVDVNLTNMFERVRARGVSIYIAGQSDHSIAYRGLIQNAERILSSATTIVLHACSNPHNIIKRVGTEAVIEESSSMSEGERTGYGTLRLKDVPKIDPNDVMDLPVGEAYVIAHGKGQRVLVAPVETTERDLAEARTYLVASSQQAPPVGPKISPVRTSTVSKPGKASQGVTRSISPAPPKAAAEDDLDEDILT